MNESGRSANLWDLVTVEWHDAYQSSSPAHHQDRSDYTPCVRRSVGWVVGMTPEHIEIAQTDDRESVMCDTSNHQDALTIPMGIVQHVTKILSNGGRSDTLRDSS